MSDNIPFDEDKYLEWEKDFLSKFNCVSCNHTIDYHSSDEDGYGYCMKWWVKRNQIRHCNCTYTFYKAALRSLFIELKENNGN